MTGSETPVIGQFASPVPLVASRSVPVCASAPDPPFGRELNVPNASAAARTRTPAATSATPTPAPPLSYPAITVATPWQEEVAARLSGRNPLPEAVSLRPRSGADHPAAKGRPFGRSGAIVTLRIDSHMVPAILPPRDTGLRNPARPATARSGQRFHFPRRAGTERLLHTELAIAITTTAPTTSSSHRNHGRPPFAFS